MIRLNKYLSLCGIASRRASDELIRSGRVSVNGKIVNTLGLQVNADDKVMVDGLTATLPAKKRYVLLNKPKGYITTTSDEHGRKTVMELVNVSERLFPVGRLDADTEGLIILTNDGELANHLIHPKFKVEKIYAALLDKSLKEADLHRLEKGIILEDGPTLPCKIHYFGKSRKEIRIYLREGRKRQIKRMLAMLNYSVRRLERLSIGPVQLGRIKRGQWRFLNEHEVTKLKQSVGLAE